jgi:3-(3-hydroxy-phenyl)propionate hydroxylase
VPTYYAASPLNTSADAPFSGDMEPGAPMDDAPVGVDGREAWLLDQVGSRFQLLLYADDPAALDRAALQRLRDAGIPVEPLVVSPRPAAVDGLRVLHDLRGLVARRYDARDGTALLLRPDQHVAARWRSLDVAAVRAAVARATCNA